MDNNPSNITMDMPDTPDTMLTALGLKTTEGQTTLQSLTNSSPENNAKQKPSIGSIVHYVSGYDGLHLAAIVTEVVAKSDVVGLRVFERDERSDFKLWEISFDETARPPGTWHWPERE